MIGALIIYSTGRLIRDSGNVLLEGVPSHIDVDDIQEKIVSLKGVKEVHDLNVWCITPTEMCCTRSHIVVEKGTDKKNLMKALINTMKDFEINHTAFQIEDERYPKSIGEH